MQKKMLTLTLTFYVCLFCGCIENVNSAQNNTLNKSSEKREINSEPVSDYCLEWELMKSNLNELEKPEFAKNGVIFQAGQPKDASGYLLSPEIVEDCEMRIKIGRLIWTIIRGSESDADRKYASQNSKIMVSVLLKIWDSPGFSSDGVSLDKYYLLNYEYFNEEDNSLFLSNLLKEKKLNIGLVNTVLRHPMQSLVPLLSELLKRAEKSDDLAEQVYLTILIEQTTKNQSMFPKLNSLADNKKIGDQNRNVIRSIIDKFKEGKTIVPEDIENLSLDIPEFEENR